ncbi:MAG: tetratricopeptide repeat protein, partial [Planctomycetes bacterium]|nr:tetratricopeptide repeat protein [Planctomycetota bacterium]
MDRSVLVAALLAAAVLLLAGVAARGEAVAVFNFQMTSETPEWRWLEKGLADRIATDFAQDRSQTVIARDEMQLLAQKMAWVPEMATTDAGRMGEIRKQLKIAHLVTGVYEVAGDQIRLIGQVVELEGRREVARKELAGPAAEVLDLQRRLSAELLAWFSKKPAAQILQTLPVWTRSLPAAKALYEGMDLYDQGRYGEAWLQFRQASREDPGYVEAVYWVGKMYYFMNRYEHARRMLERFVYLDTAHPRLGDAMVEYVHTYESADAGAEALLSLYEDLARRFPNANVWQGPRWGNAGNLRSDDWFRFKRMHVISQLGRAADVLKMGGPILDSYLWAPENGGSGAYPYGLVSLLEHYARTAELLPFTIGMGGTVLGGVPRRLAAQEGSTTWLRFDDATAPQTVRTVPRRLTGAARAGADRQT